MKKTKSKIKIDKLSPSVEGSRNFKKISLLLNAKNFSQKTETPCILIVCNQFLDILSFDTLINESIRWDQGQWKVPPCKLARSIILTPFLRVDKRCPLYRIEDGFEGMDLNLLFEDNYLLDDFNDDHLGKLLDRINEVGSTDLFTVLHQLDQKIIYPHHDFKHLTEKYFEIGMKLNDFSIQLVKYCLQSVSYTHLTLPTKRIV